MLRAVNPPFAFYLGDIMNKKLFSLISLLLVFCVLFLSFPLTAFAATDFVVEDGVLISYQGKSSSVTIPSGVYAVGDSAFENNKTITSVNLKGVSVIGDKAFANCVALKSVTNTSDISSCGAYAFFNTPFQNSYADKTLILGSVLVYSSENGDVIIDDKVVSIAPYAFAGNSNITSVFVGDKVASIGEGAFYKCTNLKEVSVSKYVTYIGAFAFEGTPYLSAVKDNFLILGNGILVDVNSTATNITVPDTVRQIGAGAFYKNTTVKSVTLPSSVTAINMRAFSGCASLTDVVLPENLVLIDNEAFSNCTSLKSIVVPASVTLMGESIFIGCTNLQTAYIMTSADISRGMFASCSALRNVRLTDGVNSIGDYAFYNCKTLIEVSVPDSVDNISSLAFNGTDKVTVWCHKNSYAETFCASNKIKSGHIGDANLDNSVNIKDATLIQKVSAKLVTMSFVDSMRGDYDFNGEINVRDATGIQKYIAGISE